MPTVIRVPTLIQFLCNISRIRQTILDDPQDNPKCPRHHPDVQPGEKINSANNTLQKEPNLALYVTILKSYHNSAV